MEIEESLRSIAAEFPAESVAHQLADVRRTAFHLRLIVERKGTALSVCDIGGGLGLFSLGCAALGIRSILVDDFGDEMHSQFWQSVLGLHRRYGVEVIAADVIQQEIDLQPETLDVITSFDAVEHWHHSPKRLFRSISRALRPGGLFILAAPNCVNLRKRLTVPFGHGKWSQMRDWYESERFRGHVREPDLGDLKYIARDMGLTRIEVLGRNWMGYISPHPVVRALTAVTDRPLQWFPSLCSDIYVIGVKGSGPASYRCTPELVSASSSGASGGERS